MELWIVQIYPFFHFYAWISTFSCKGRNFKVKPVYPICMVTGRPEFMNSGGSVRYGFALNVLTKVRMRQRASS